MRPGVRVFEGAAARPALDLSYSSLRERFADELRPRKSIYWPDMLASMIVGLAIVIWSIWFLDGQHGRSVFLGLFVLSFLVGGGIGQIAFFIPAWAFATRMNKPLNWWRKVLPKSIWPFLSRLWIITLVLALITMSIGLEMAIFGYFPGITEPALIESTALLFVLSAAILCMVSFILGFGHELRRIELNNKFAL